MKNGVQPTDSLTVNSLCGWHKKSDLPVAIFFVFAMWLLAGSLR